MIRNEYWFKRLTRADLSILLKWLNSPHVQQFWDTGTLWTQDLVEKKYESYIEGYKLVDERRLPMHAFMIYHEISPIGYIQFYNASDFPRDGYQLTHVLKETTFNHLHLAAIDIFIADITYVGKGIGSSILKQFLKEFVWENFDACLVDPNKTNGRAIRAYEKAGFIKITETYDHQAIIMIAKREND